LNKQLDRPNVLWPPLFTPPADAEPAFVDAFEYIPLFSAALVFLSGGDFSGDGNMRAFGFNPVN